MLTNNADLTSSQRYLKAKIVVGSLEITNVKSIRYHTDWNGNIGIGNAISSYFTAEIPDQATSIDVSNCVLYIGAGSTTQWTKIGTFYISPKDCQSRLGYTTFTAYDKMHSNTLKTYHASMTFPTTLQAILNDVCSQCGITSISGIASKTLQNDILSGCTCRDVIAYIAGYNACNAYVNENGGLVFKWFTNSGYTADGTKANVPYSGIANTSVSFLSCNTGAGTITAGTGNTGICMENPLIDQTRLNAIYNSLHGFTYRKADVDVPFGDFRVQSGDIITVTTSGQSLSIPVMSCNWEYDGGISAKYSAHDVGDAVERSISSRRFSEYTQRWDTSNQISYAIDHATAMITGADGGYIRINYGGNGKTAELLIMDTNDINTATNVWRFNQNGLGHSNTGYDGQYTTAITADGWIVAERIAGTEISGLRFRADGGAGTSTWHMTLENGALRLFDSSNNLVGEISFYSYQGARSLYISGNVTYNGEQTGLIMINPWYKRASTDEEINLCTKIEELESRLSALEGG